MSLSIEIRDKFVGFFFNCSSIPYKYHRRHYKLEQIRVCKKKKTNTKLKIRNGNVNEKQTIMVNVRVQCSFI